MDQPEQDVLKIELPTPAALQEPRDAAAGGTPGAPVTGRIG